MVATFEPQGPPYPPRRIDNRSSHVRREWRSEVRLDMGLPVLGFVGRQLAKGRTALHPRAESAETGGRPLRAPRSDTARLGPLLLRRPALDAPLPSQRQHLSVPTNRQTIEPPEVSRERRRA